VPLHLSLLHLSFLIVLYLSYVWCQGNNGIFLLARRLLITVGSAGGDSDGLLLAARGSRPAGTRRVLLQVPHET
jgi:hypothetical protein